MFAVAAIALAAPAIGVCESDPRADLDKSLVNDKAYGELFRELKSDFPKDYAVLLNHVVDAMNGPDAEKRVEQVSYETMHAIMQSHVADAASAPTQYLVDFLGTQQSFLASLKVENVKMCAQFASVGLPNEANLSPRAKVRLLETEVAEFRAAHAGSEHPVARHDVDKDDVEALRKALVATGLSDDLIKSDLGESDAKLSDEDECASAEGLYEALSHLPPEAEARWASAIVMASKE